MRIIAFSALLLSSVLCPSRLVAQNTITFDEYIILLPELLAEEYNVEDENEDEGENLEKRIEQQIERLTYLHQNPLNINTATVQQLLILPFLSERQAKDIQTYIQRNGEMKSLGELMLIPTIDFDARRLIPLFCYAADSTTGNGTTLHPSQPTIRQQLAFQTDFPLYTKAGFADVADSVLQRSPNKVYQGNSLRSSLRYTIHTNRRVSAGLQLEKDAGETNIDYISAHVQMKNLWAFRSIIIGDYKASAGHGLVLGNALNFGKSNSASLSNANSTLNSSASGNRSSRISPHTSLSEYDYMRGAAATLDVNEKISITAFMSLRNVDGTLLNDSSGAISAFKTDGLHRTLLEKSKRGNTRNFSYGGFLQYADSHLRLGFAAVSTHLSRSLSPKHNTPSSYYRLYQLHGDSFTTMGMSYSYDFGIVNLTGETAKSFSQGANPEIKADDEDEYENEYDNDKEEANGSASSQQFSYTNNDGDGWATINALGIQVNSYTSLSLIHRYYQPRFSSFYGHSFGENSRPSGEQGFYVGAITKLSSTLVINAYVDAFHFSVPKYQVSQPSNGWDAMIQLAFGSRDKTNNCKLRYRIKTKQKDCKLSNTDTQLCNFTNQYLKFQYDLLLNGNVSFKWVANASFAFHPVKGTDSGFLVSQTVNWRPIQSKTMAVKLQTSWFNTDSYDARVYGYEPTVLYQMGMANYSNHGLRAVGILSVPLSCQFQLSARIAATRYFNRDTIGSGLDLINASHREDICIQIRWKNPW